MTNGRIAPLIASNLAKLPGVRHGFFTRQGGVSSGIYESLNVGLGSKDASEDVLENRRRAASWFGGELKSLLTCYQIHSSRVVNVQGPWPDKPEAADGVATTTPGLICAALSADCAPVLLVEPEARVVAACHAGWKGALGGVIETALEVMTQKGALIRRVVAAVGPCIGPQSYEVGLEFQATFEAQDLGAGRFFRSGGTGDKKYFDLPAYALDRLARAGVQDAEWVGGDTCAEEDLFFSNRRAFKRGEADYGRLLSAVTLI